MYRVAQTQHIVPPNWLNPTGWSGPPDAPLETDARDPPPAFLLDVRVNIRAVV